MKSIALSLVLCVLNSVSLMAESVEIFYFDKQDAYRFSSFEADGPVLDKVDDAEVGAYEGERHDTWWVKGPLPLEAGKAFTLADYRTKRVANAYVDRFKPRQYSVLIQFSYKELVVPLDLAGASANLVIGWELDGELKDFQVRPFRTLVKGSRISEWLIPESSFGGRPVCWVVEGGEIVSLDTVHPWDRALFGESVSIDELAKYRSPKRELTALHYVAANGDLELARALIEADKKLVKAFDKQDWSPLSAAVDNGRNGVVELLLEHNAPLVDGWEGFDSIVRKGCSAGHFETVKLMAPGKAKGQEGRWHYSWGATDALNHNYQDIAIYLIENGADFTVPKENRGDFALAKAAAGYPDLALRLFEKFKVDPTYDKDGYNLLHSVASYGDVDLLRSVTALGVPIDTVTGTGVLPVDFAVGLGNVDAICWFLDNGGRSKLGENSVDPLKYAIGEKQLRSVECLIGYGFDVNKEVSNGVSPLMYAVYLEQFDIAKALVDAGGVWVMDSLVLDSVLSRLLRADEADLFRTLVAQGWKEDRLVFGAFDLASVANFYGAERILAVQSEMGWEVSGASIERVSDVETKPSLAAPLEVDYPLDLQEQFGSRSITVRVALSADGIPLLAEAEPKKGEEGLVGVVEKTALSMRFTPASKGGVAVPVSLKFKIPLNVDFDPKSVLSMAEVHEKPSALRMVTPLYPYEMQFRKAKGQVVVEFVLAADGTVHRARAVNYSHSAFVSPAINCVIESRWNPAKVDGKAVACKVRIPVHFAP